jgi:hypothetical protein
MSKTKKLYDKWLNGEKINYIDINDAFYAWKIALEIKNKNLDIPVTLKNIVLNGPEAIRVYWAETVGDEKEMLKYVKDLILLLNYHFNTNNTEDWYLDLLLSIAPKNKILSFIDEMDYAGELLEMILKK